MSETAGKPDGPLVFVPGLGMEVGTFSSKRADLIVGRDASNETWLMHHVPMNKRGMYREKDLPEGFDAELRLDDRQYVLCGGVAATTVPGHRTAGDPCKARALNRSGFCGRHGGQLHPLDKVIGDESSPALQRTQDPSKMSRWQKLCAGIITVQDLDQEELLKGRTRDEATGRFVGPGPRNIPKALHDRMVKELFSRSDQILQENLIVAVNTVAEIAAGTAFEAQDRLKAATWIFERLRGKNPDVVVHTQDKPWEHVFSSIGGGSRAESRAARGVATEDDLAELEGSKPIDAEFIEMVDDSVRDPDDEGWDNKPGEPAAYLKFVQPVADPTQYHEVVPSQHVSVDDTPPQESLDRQTYERKAAEERRLAEDPAEAKRLLKERLSKARGRRMAARNRGFTSIDVIPLEAKTREIKGEFVTKFFEPKAVAAAPRRAD